MILDTVSSLALLELYKAKTIPHVESDLYYLDSMGVSLAMLPSRRYVFFCTSVAWSNTVLDVSFQNRFQNSTHFSLVQRGLLGAISFRDSEVPLISDAFAAPFDRLDVPSGFYLFSVPLDELYGVEGIKLCTASTSRYRQYDYLSM